MNAIATTESTGEQDAGFAELGLSETLLETLDALGYDAPTPIQQQAIPALLAGQDLLGLAATGTGKTAAFALPLLQHLFEGESQEADRSGPAALVLVPTRELARQVGKALRSYGQGYSAEVLEIYGGSSMRQQLRALSRGVDAVVATPGRALDHLERGSLTLESVKVVVLDEADEMLDMGFAEDIERILRAVPQSRQLALFSATFPERLQAVARSVLRSPVRVEARKEPSSAEQVQIREIGYPVERRFRPAAIRRLIEIESPEAALLFCKTRESVDSLTDLLSKGGLRAEALHGGLSQEQRDRVMGRLRAGEVSLVVATDVAARGLDVDRLTHVFNVELPPSSEQYVHRIGRVGRAGRSGVAITLADPRELRRLQAFARHNQRSFEVSTLPSVEDLRACRRERLAGRLQEATLTGDLDPWRAMAEDLADEHALLDVTAAALLLLSRMGGMPEDEVEIPSPQPPRQQARPPRPARSDLQPRRPDTVRLWIGLGFQAGLRPGDLVGAIAGETGLPGRAIGAIDIAPKFSLVDVPAAAADEVIEALRRTSLRGRRVRVRRDREPQR